MRRISFRPVRHNLPTNFQPAASGQPPGPGLKCAPDFYYAGNPAAVLPSHDVDRTRSRTSKFSPKSTTAPFNHNRRHPTPSSTSITLAIS
ncbi:uncharacterized protein L3040_005907 [Drepanopeziza brunnea f. sp. 'multigermtubi']|uniref:uncharacterized protein n=1 Tax=Drepanopeziza brunnea f. sp. 'multigermtubi' TaxID=698441 RepID=UPI002384C237|nr:hypothetical protein L3040_005907 [Drepanopeziza brunnea f. sp. 'multigermtubi']